MKAKTAQAPRTNQKSVIKFSGPPSSPRDQRPRPSLGDQVGFTLIELMITVGIVGILVSLSSASYKKYQRKTHQSEAKIALSGVFSLEKSFFAEYSSYIPAFDAIGFNLDGARQFYAVSACMTSGGPWTGSVTGYAGSSSVVLYSAVNNPYTYNWLMNGPTCNFGNPGSCANISPAGDPQAFVSTAFGMLCTGCFTDVWQISDQKVLTNCNIGT